MHVVCLDIAVRLYYGRTFPTKLYSNQLMFISSFALVASSSCLLSSFVLVITMVTNSIIHHHESKLHPKIRRPPIGIPTQPCRIPIHTIHSPLDRAAFPPSSTRQMAHSADRQVTCRAKTPGFRCRQWPWVCYLWTESIPPLHSPLSPADLDWPKPDSGL